jgi:broad specificity phosphatase PhoE
MASTNRLAAVLTAFEPTRIVASPERKAVETGRILADALQLPLGEAAHFSEQGAGPHEFIDDYRAFRSLVRDHFNRPDEVIMRHESSLAAGRRFGEGVKALDGRDAVPVIVTHGRIMASWLSALSGANAWDIWTGLRMPDLVEVDLEARAFRRIDFPLF